MAADKTRNDDAFNLRCKATTLSVIMALERIQKILAAAGYGSRRDCEQLVLDGRVGVNGEIADELPLLVDPDVDEIYVDRRPLRRARPVYLVLNKPAGVYCTMSRGEGRKTVGDLLAKLREPVEPVGRTDADFAGLVLLTNDRTLASVLADPRRGVEKTYRVEVQAAISPEKLSTLREGIRLSEGRTSPMRVKVIHADRQRTMLEIVINDHLQREIPRVLAKHGLKAKRVMRIKFGKLTLRDIPQSAARMLAPEEIEFLKKAASGASAAAIESPPRRPTQRPRPADKSKPSPRPAGPRVREKEAPPPRESFAPGRKRRMILPQDE